MVAKKHKVSVSEMEREMQLAIDAAYQTPNRFALTVPCSGDTPTPEELAMYIAQKIADEFSYK